MIAGPQKFKPGDRIRSVKEPGKLFYVVYVNRYHTQAVDLDDRSEKSIPFVILERNYDQWVQDLDVSCNVKKNDELFWSMGAAI